MSTDRPSPFTIPTPTFEFVEEPSSQPPPQRPMTVGALILNLTGFADYYEGASADIDAADVYERPHLRAGRDAHTNDLQRFFRSMVGIDRVREYVLSHYHEELTLGTARRVLGDLIREHKLSVDSAEALSLQDAMNLLEGTNGNKVPLPAPDRTNPNESERPEALPTGKVPNVVSLNVLRATLEMTGFPEWRERLETWPEVSPLRLRCNELFPTKPFDAATIELLIAWFQSRGLTPEQARHLPLSDAVRRLSSHDADAEKGATKQAAERLTPGQSSLLEEAKLFLAQKDREIEARRVAQQLLPYMLFGQNFPFSDRPAG